LIAERDLTQTAAAKLVQLKQPDLSKLLRGHFKLVSVEKLMLMLTALDHDVEITIKPHRKRGVTGKITFRTAA
jgi:predicted XRE-type DNA-binding protein